jgi:hypothetical protein
MIHNPGRSSSALQGRVVAVRRFRPTGNAFGPSFLDDYAVNLATFEFAAGRLGFVFLKAGETEAR